MGEEVSPRGKRTKELLGFTSTISMTRPILTIAERKLGYRFMPAEAAWILSGDNRVKTIAPYSKEIHRFSDDGVYFFGAYGPPLRDQYSYVIDTLVKDPSSRQAVATIWRQRPGSTKDVPCTVAMQWFLREEYDPRRYVLHCCTTMRSSDAWLGWPYDVFNFSMISGFVAAHLVNRVPYPVMMGNLYLTAGSQHLYEQNWQAAENCLTSVGDDAQWSKFEYEPFNLYMFTDDPDSLIQHLWCLANRQVPYSQPAWAQELIQGAQTSN